MNSAGAQWSPLPPLTWMCYSGCCSAIIISLLLSHFLLFLSLEIFAFKKSCSVILVAFQEGEKVNACVQFVFFVSRSTVGGANLEEPSSGKRGRMARVT